MWKAGSLYGLLLIRFIRFISIVLIALLILSAAFDRFIIMSKIWLRLDFSDDSRNKGFIMLYKGIMEVQFGLI